MTQLYANYRIQLQRVLNYTSKSILSQLIIQNLRKAQMKQPIVYSLDIICAASIHNQQSYWQQMHNIRKIKRKKKAKIMNPQQLAQQKLFQISRFQDEEERFNEVDLFIEKLQPKINQSQTSILHKNKTKPHNRTYAGFYEHQLEKNQKKNEQLALVNEIHTHSSEIIGKKPLQLISYVLFDRRERLGNISVSKNRFDSLAKIKRKMNLKKSKSTQQQKSEEENAYKNQECRKGESFSHWKLSKKSEPPFQIKNIKLFSKYIAVLPAVNP